MVLIIKNRLEISWVIRIIQDIARGFRPLRSGVFGEHALQGPMNYGMF